MRASAIARVTSLRLRHQCVGLLVLGTALHTRAQAPSTQQTPTGASSSPTSSSASSSSSSSSRYSISSSSSSSQSSSSSSSSSTPSSSPSSSLPSSSSSSIITSSSILSSSIIESSSISSSSSSTLSSSSSSSTTTGGLLDPAAATASGGGMSNGAKAGIGIGVAAGVILIIVLFGMIFTRLSRRQSKEDEEADRRIEEAKRGFVDPSAGIVDSSASSYADSEPQPGPVILQASHSHRDEADGAPLLGLPHNNPEVPAYPPYAQYPANAYADVVAPGHYTEAAPMPIGYDYASQPHPATAAWTDPYYQPAMADPAYATGPPPPHAVAAPAGQWHHTDAPPAWTGYH